jgi:antitoxin VapB
MQRWTAPISRHMLRPMSKRTNVPAARRVRLFKNGRSQAVRIPREFELPGKEAVMRKVGQRLIIEPARKKSLLAVLATLKPIDEEFPPIDDKPPEPVDL